MEDNNSLAAGYLIRHHVVWRIRKVRNKCNNRANAVDLPVYEGEAIAETLVLNKIESQNSSPTKR